jgi:hypothetical protein
VEAFADEEERAFLQERIVLFAKTVALRLTVQPTEVMTILPRDCS